MAAKAGDIEAIREKNSGLIEKTEKLLENIGIILRKLEDEKEEKEQAAAPDQSLLTKLLEGCKRYNLTLMEEALTELEKYNYDTGAELITWLRKEFDNLEYDAIQKRLEQKGEPNSNGPPDFEITPGNQKNGK
jgi:hypothetical protein